MSSEVDSAPRNGDFEEDDLPQDLNGDGGSENDADLFGDDDEEPDQSNEYICPCAYPLLPDQLTDPSQVCTENSMTRSSTLVTMKTETIVLRPRWKMRRDCMKSRNR